VNASRLNHCGRSTFEKTSYVSPNHAASAESAAARTIVQIAAITPFRAPS
jgi:hypothetical protein